jgi:hypothetical protein
MTAVKAEASSSGSVYPARRSLQPSQDVNDRKLADQLPIPWQLEPKPVNDLLSHEVVPHVPTDPPVQPCRHDIVNPKVHALYPKGTERRFPLPPSIWKRIAMPVRRLVPRRCVICVGGRGDITQRGIDAVLTRY